MFLERRNGKSRSDNLVEFNRRFGSDYHDPAAVYRGKYRDRLKRGNPQRLLAAWNKDHEFLRADLEQLREELAPELRFVQDGDCPPS
jgi:hypothetical protein